MRSIVQDIARKRHGNREDLATRLCLLGCFGSCFGAGENGRKISVARFFFLPERNSRTRALKYGRRTREQQ